MDGLFTFLIFAGLFYLMMRFGCGAHMVHGHGSEKGEKGKHVDPVCGKDVPPHEGYGKMHQGQLYRFCSRDCLDKFEAQPDRFLREREEEAS